MCIKLGPANAHRMYSLKRTSL